YELSRVNFVDEILLSLLDVLELVSLRYKGFDFIALHVTNQIGKYLIFLEGTPQKTQGFEIYRPQIHLRQRPADAAGSSVATSEPQHGQQNSHPGAAHNVQHGKHGRAAA